MPEITSGDIAEAFRLSLLAFEGAITEQKAIDRLTEERGMNRSSAGGYVRTLRWMLAGEGYKRTLNFAATRYYLDGILRELGRECAEAALRSLLLHVAYYREVSGSRQRALEGLAREFQLRLDSERTASSDGAFQARVRKASALAPAERRKRLPPSGWKPEVIRVQSSVFVRNRYVAAEVLARAKGICESCRQTAPFTRSSDGSPYLEVHHKIMLAEGGEDTTDNAIALCPNCHRRMHYGDQRQE